KGARLGLVGIISPGIDNTVTAHFQSVKGMMAKERQLVARDGQRIVAFRAIPHAILNKVTLLDVVSTGDSELLAILLPDTAIQQLLFTHHQARSLGNGAVIRRQVVHLICRNCNRTAITSNQRGHFRNRQLYFRVINHENVRHRLCRQSYTTSDQIELIQAFRQTVELQPTTIPIAFIVSAQHTAASVGVLPVHRPCTALPLSRGPGTGMYREGFIQRPPTMSVEIQSDAATATSAPIPAIATIGTDASILSQDQRLRSQPD